MVSHMKTTIDISKSLFEEAWEVAGRTGTTFKEVVESALRQFLKGQKRPRPFRLRKHPFGGKGLLPEVAEGGWAEMRRRIYEGRGG